MPEAKPNHPATGPVTLSYINDLQERFTSLKEHL